MDPSSAPLADYFWIAGIDSISYNETSQSSSSHIRDRSPNNAPTSPPIEGTIDEGSEGEHSDAILGSAPRATARHSRTNSWNRLSKLSSDARLSIQSLDTITPTTSNRSSATIRAVPPIGTNGTTNGGGLLGEFDFDRALMKFANERESFLDDLSFSAGTVLQNRPPMTNRAERIKHEEGDFSPGLNSKMSTLGRVGGTLRRKISFRDMSSMRRQPTVSRSGECLLLP